VLRRLRFTIVFARIRWRAALAISCVLAVSFQGSFAAVNAADRLDKLEREASFHIEPGPLESALIQFSRQSGIQVVLSARITGISVTAIDGRRNAREVLAALLNTNGLTFAIVGETVTVYAVDPKIHPTAVSPPGDSPKSAPESKHRR
jgi:hypothetical protein